MRKLFFFPFAWRYDDTPSRIKFFSLMSWFIICPTVLLCMTVTSSTPNDEQSQTGKISLSSDARITPTPNTNAIGTISNALGMNEQSVSPSRTSAGTQDKTPATKTFSPTPDPVKKINEIVYISSEVVNIRACASTECKILGTVKYGASIRVTGLYRGEWYRLVYDDGDGWISKSLTSSTAPATIAPRPTSRPVTRQPQATIPPPPSGGVTCGGATTCGQMASCEQAYACLRAGRSSLDRDHDGVPCESICPGG